jgi:hypothetical protein
VKKNGAPSSGMLARRYGKRSENGEHVSSSWTGADGEDHELQYSAARRPEKVILRGAHG